MVIFLASKFFLYLLLVVTLIILVSLRPLREKITTRPRRLSRSTSSSRLRSLNSPNSKPNTSRLNPLVYIPKSTDNTPEPELSPNSLVIPECNVSDDPPLGLITFSRTDFTPTCTWRGKSSRAGPSFGDFFQLSFSPIMSINSNNNQTTRKYIVRWGPLFGLGRGLENDGFAVIGQDDVISQNGWNGGLGILTCGGSSIMNVTTLACCVEVTQIEVDNFDPSGGFGFDGVVSLTWPSVPGAEQYLISVIIIGTHPNPQGGNIYHRIYTGGYRTPNFTGNLNSTSLFFNVASNASSPYILEKFTVWAFKNSAWGTSVNVNL